jgi:hypothetical protein
MKKRKETRGRKPKMHKPLGASFDDVLSALSDSSYKSKKQLKSKKKA